MTVFIGVQWQTINADVRGGYESAHQPADREGVRVLECCSAAAEVPMEAAKSAGRFKSMRAFEVMSDKRPRPESMAAGRGIVRIARVPSRPDPGW